MPPQQIPSEVDQISALLEQMMLEDPYLRAMHEGKMKWGDLMLIYEKENPRPKKQETAASAERCITPPRERAAEQEQEPEAPWAPVKAKSAPEPRYEPVEDCGICTLRLGNLPRDISVQELKTIFSAHGTVRDVHIPKNMDKSSPYYGTIRGFAMVEFAKSWEATNTLTAFYGSLTIRTKKITLEFAKSDRKRPDQMAAAMGGAGASSGAGTSSSASVLPRLQRQDAQGTPPLRPYIQRQTATWTPIHKEETLPYNHFRQEDGSILHF